MIHSNVSSNESVFLPDCPPKFSASDFDRLFLHCKELSASDIYVGSGCQVLISRFGRLEKVVERTLENSEVENLINHLYGANGATQVRSGIAVDCSYSLRVDRMTRIRFRVNGVGFERNGQQGIQITLRIICSDPPGEDMIDLTPDLWRAFTPKQGLILVTGSTGSGKSTFLASCIRKLLEEPDGHRTILTFEAPIEFVYDNVDCPSSQIFQSEVPRHLPDFPSVIANSLRRSPDIILIGEARDAATIEATIEAAKTGHLVYSTVHTNSVSETIQRLAMAFPSNGSLMLFDLISSIRMIITQRLVKTKDGKRTAIRESLVFDDEVRSELLMGSGEKLVTLTRDIVKRKGITMESSLEAAYKKGILEESDYLSIKGGHS